MVRNGVPCEIRWEIRANSNIRCVYRVVETLRDLPVYVYVLDRVS